ncbi:hypothetical protein PR048_031842 [Dryococelus australis]|uniref:HAT C-terminal dimerisation domain-containing protein n=1 Tax=Dryococelus australis TaxID=614101 RepID=A0ABQ9G9B9_9NEOP|nr:hypothetical protein PR048_031842 [Dryococelus australis]
MQWVQETGNIVQGSPKRKKKFADLAAVLDLKGTDDPKPLCPTRWIARKQKDSKRLQQLNYAVPDYQLASPEELYRKVYFEALDSITGEIQRRFEHTDYEKYANLEEALATQPIEWNSKVTETWQEKYFDLQQLGHQTEMLKKLSPHCTKTIEYVQRLRDMHPETRFLFPELEKFICYLLVTPVTSATAKRSFSTLRILNSYLRTAMT